MQPPGGMPEKIPLPNIKNMIAVASGKGGVGKSTVATNLAMALHMKDRVVGILDADIYGPSVPTMLGVPGQIDQETTPLPIEKHGLKILSMGFFVPASQAVIWRGPMIDKYLKQFLLTVDWGPLDFMIVDLPPGTGDAQLTLTQSAPLTGAVIVTTPQEVSLIDARKGLEMFRQVRVPVMGIIENMSYFMGDDGKRYEIFRHGGGRRLAEESHTQFLGEIPIDGRVAECGDNGEPIVMKYPDLEISKAYNAIADVIINTLEESEPPDELPTVDL